MKTIHISGLSAARLSFNYFGIGLTAFLLTSCFCGEPPSPVIDICPPGHPCQNPPDPGSCNADTYVTVVNVSCGVGVWGPQWLQLDNGEYLQPWLSNNTDPVQTGEKYKISFGTAPRDGLYDTVVTCHAAVPPSTAIRINCIVPVTVP